MKKKTIWEMGRDSVEQYRRKGKLPLVVVLDNVRSLNNIGSIFRTCDAFAVERLVLCGISQPPPSPEIHKTALGAEDSVDWSYYATTAEAVDALQAVGYVVCCLASPPADTSSPTTPSGAAKCSIPPPTTMPKAAPSTNSTNSWPPTPP